MLHLTRIRAGVSGVLLLLAMGLPTSTPATAQSTLLSSDEDGPPKVLEGPTKQTPKVSFAFRASELYLAGGTAFDMTTTVRGLDHPTNALRSDGTLLTHYYASEKGWAGCFGKRDIVTAVGANVFLNVEIDRFSRKLYARGGRWRALAYGVVLTKGTLNVIAAGYNIRNDERINHDVRTATGYKGLIVWSK
jgi:hypothetical protein